MTWLARANARVVHTMELIVISIIYAATVCFGSLAPSLSPLLFSPSCSHGDFACRVNNVLFRSAPGTSSSQVQVITIILPHESQPQTSPPPFLNLALLSSNPQFTIHVRIPYPSPSVIPSPRSSRTVSPAPQPRFPWRGIDSLVPTRLSSGNELPRQTASGLPLPLGTYRTLQPT